MDGLQQRSNTLQQWCGDNALEVSAEKSVAIVFSNKRNLAELKSRKLVIMGEELEWSDEATYVGVTLSSNTRQLFKKHLMVKAQKATSTARALLGLKSQLEDLRPSRGIQFFKSLIDPHLIHASDVMVEDTIHGKGLMLSVQTNYLRRLLQVNNRCFRAPLHVLTGLIPISDRRLSLALKALPGYSRLPSTSVVSNALKESVALANQGVHTWVYQIREQSRSRFRLRLTDEDVFDDRCPLALATKVEVYSLKEQCDIVQRSTLLPILHSLAQEISSNISNTGSTTSLGEIHPCLELESISQRKAFVRFLLGQAPLRVHVGRIKDPIWKVQLPKELRKCRLGCDAVEDELHLLFNCEAAYPYHEAREWWKSVLQVQFVASGLPPMPYPNASDAVLQDRLHRWMRSREASKPLARFVAWMLAIHKEYVVDG